MPDKKSKALIDWMLETEISVAEVAQRLEVAKSTVYALRAGHFTPGLSLAIRIQEMTGGRVPAESWGRQ